MKIFNATLEKITKWLSIKDNQFQINNISNDQFSLLLCELLNLKIIKTDKCLLILTDSSEQATNLHTILNINLKHKVYLYPSFNLSIYDDVFSSETDLLKRWSILQNIIKDNNFSIVIADINSAQEITPPRSFFKNNTFTIEVSEIIDRYELAKKLTTLGYQNIHSISTFDGNDGETIGSFSIKGEVVDIYPMSSGPIRIFYFDDMIERIAPIDPENMRTIIGHDLNMITLDPAPFILTQREYVLNLRETLPRSLDRKSSKSVHRENIFSQLKEEQFFNNYPIYTPLFFKEKENECLTEYFSNQIIITMNLEKIKAEHSINKDELFINFNVCKEDASSECLLPSPARYFKELSIDHLKNLDVSNILIDYHLEENFNNSVTFNYKDLSYITSTSINEKKLHSRLEQISKSLVKKFKYEGEIYFCYDNESAKEEFSFLMKEYLTDINSDLLKRIEYKKIALQKSFFDENNNVLFLSEAELYQKPKTRKKQKSKRQNVDLFAEQMASLKPNDYVIHSTFGTGRYLGLKQIEFGDTNSDYLVIEYKNNDKVFVPVFKMNLIQKQADSTSKVVVNNLRNNKFDQLKERAKHSAKKLAFDLIKLQAKRNSSEGYTFNPPDQLYQEFETSCPFTLTPDQHTVITDILDDMCSKKPMDRLVCGDVGFGKTELAMRAAFKAVEDKKQVAILVPTTILALQHFESFKERFKNFPVNIDFLSRFKSRKEELITLENLENQKIDIIIGTHKLLGKSIKYKDLGLVIVDEEHRFGVSHKEKLKLFRETIDFLTLTATPIPRTLQLSFLGIRQISLIQTPPPKRQSIKTFLIKSDDQTIKHAIQKELNRGGQAYIVHNRVNDMEQYANYIRELCPNAKIAIGHGQMNEKELEVIIKDFYSGKYHILLATTIIESGIDIPNANTMIVDNADKFGLAQLHQLRGRIGRSDRKAFAYFVVSKQKISPEAERRLKALQTYADIGTGFHLANCDLEIRGAGDILGADQSGHVEKVGLELYMQLLQEAVAEIKGEAKVLTTDFELLTPFSASIPENFVTSSKERLKLYKKFSNCKNADAIEEINEYLNDVYGNLPVELTNLTYILKSKIHLATLPLKSVKVVGRQIVYQFIQEKLNSNSRLLDRLITFCFEKPKDYQLTPDHKMIIQLKDELIPEKFFQHSKDIARLLDL